MREITHLGTKDFLFIIGSPRSGTTMLQVMLGSHPQVATTVELTLFSRYMAPWLKAWDDEVRNAKEKGWNQGLPFVWKEADFIAYLHQFLDRSYDSVIAEKPTATHVLDKHPGYSEHVATIKRLLPRARFLHMIRDGRDVACSMVAARKTRGFGTGTIQESAKEWNRLVRAAQQASQFTGDYLEVRYEDLLDRGAEAFAEILDFSRLPHDPKWLAETMAANTFDKMKEHRRTGNPNVASSEAHYRKGRAGVWKEEFSVNDGFLFERHAGRLLRQLGYASDTNWWSDSAAVRLLTKVLSRIRRA
jgi:hypothetical protein